MAKVDMTKMEKKVADAKRALATKAANRGQKPYYRNGKLVRGHGEQDGATYSVVPRNGKYRAIVRTKQGVQNLGDFDTPKQATTEMNRFRKLGRTKYRESVDAYFDKRWERNEF